MSHILVEKFLSYLDRISPLSAESKELILSFSYPILIPKYDDLQSIGQTCTTIYFVYEGIARIYYYKEDKDVTEYFALEQDLIIRAESLFHHRPSTKGIQAIRDTTFMAIPAVPLFNCFEIHHDVERLFRKVIEKAYVETINRLEALQFCTAEERYRALLSKSPDLVKHIPLKFIASYLGITQVSLSRIRATLS